MRFDSLILLGLDGLAILLGEVSVVLGAHTALFPVDAGLLMLDVGGLAGGELAALDTLSDAVLLVLPALVDGGWGRGSRGGLREDSGGGEGSDEGEFGNVHDELL